MKSILFCLVLLSATIAQAQTLSVYLDGAYSQPLMPEDFATHYNPGPQIGLGVDFYPSERITVRFGFTGTQFQPKDSEFPATASPGNTNLITMGWRFQYNLLPTMLINPYLSGGYHVLRYSADGVRFQLNGPNYAAQSHSHYTTQATAGGGVSIRPYRGVQLFLEGSTAFAFTEIKQTWTATLGGGFRYILK